MANSQGASGRLLVRISAGVSSTDLCLRRARATDCGGSIGADDGDPGADAGTFAMASGRLCVRISAGVSSTDLCLRETGVADVRISTGVSNTDLGLRKAGATDVRKTAGVSRTDLWLRNVGVGGPEADDGTFASGGCVLRADPVQSFALAMLTGCVFA